MQLAESCRRELSRREELRGVHLVRASGSTGRLADDFRLVEDGQRRHPARVLQSHEPAASRLAAGQHGDLVDEVGPCVRDREGHPARVGYPSHRRHHPTHHLWQKNPRKVVLGRSEQRRCA